MINKVYMVCLVSSAKIQTVKNLGKCKIVTKTDILFLAFGLVNYIFNLSIKPQRSIEVGTAHKYLRSLFPFYN